MNVILYGNKAFADVIYKVKMKLYLSRVSFHLYGLCPYKEKRRDTETGHTGRRWPCEDKGRDGVMNL